MIFSFCILEKIFRKAHRHNICNARFILVHKFNKYQKIFIQNKYGEINDKKMH